MSALLIVLIGAVPAVPQTPTPQRMLATIDAAAGFQARDVTEARFASLLKQLSSTFVESPKQIADVVVKTQELLKKDAISASLLAILEGLNTLPAQKVKGTKITEFAAAYITLRSQGWSHDRAVTGLRELVASMP